MYNYLYTFKEVLLDPWSMDNPYGPIFNHDGNGVALNQFARLLFSSSELPTWTLPANPDYKYMEEIFERICVLLQADDVYFWISKTKYDLTNEQEWAKLEAEAMNKIVKLYEKLHDTKDYYLGLIKAQEALIPDMMDDVTNTTESWFNDTPQNKGEYVDTNYTTTYNKSKTSNSVGNTSLKLENVRLTILDIYDRWLDEFKEFRIWL